MKNFSNMQTTTKIDNWILLINTKKSKKLFYNTQILIQKFYKFHFLSIKNQPLVKNSIHLIFTPTLTTFPTHSGSNKVISIIPGFKFNYSRCISVESLFEIQHLYSDADRKQRRSWELHVRPIFTHRRHCL
jgi:hypothetical protein